MRESYGTMPPERVNILVNIDANHLPLGLRDPGRRPSRSETVA
jgi:hypothetical protein